MLFGDNDTMTLGSKGRNPRYWMNGLIKLTFEYLAKIILIAFIKTENKNIWQKKTQFVFN